MSRRRRVDEPVEWNFFSFPVAFGFAVGGFIVLLLAPFMPLGLMFTFFLFLTSFGMAHIANRWIRRRTLDGQRRRAEEAERERRAAASRAANEEVQASQARPRRRRRVRRGRGDGG